LNNPVSISIVPLTGIPLIQPGDDLVSIILAALQRMDYRLAGGDVLVISSKIVSKAEGRLVDLNTVTPGAEAVRIAAETRKDPRIVELVLQESVEISRKAPGILVTRHRLGFVSANAGIDQSNVSDDADKVLLLPFDPDGTAIAIQKKLGEASGAEIGIIISDSHGRPFRMGNVGVAIGVAGMPALLDLRGQSDLFGRTLQVSMQGYADLVACAAHLVCGEGDEGLPVVLVRGLRHKVENGRGSDLVRSPEQDLYR
jgi:coenzyme F420-0:L-glutamate ligase / coenzyme F420-1:gamma-L-glutamate ligase